MKVNWQRLVIISGLILAVALAAGYGYVRHQIKQFAQQPVTLQQPTLVTVTPGQSVYAVVRSWRQQGWINQHNWLRWLLKQHPELGAIRAGTYQIEAGLTLEQALAHLAQGHEHQFSITFVEGSRWLDWQQQLQQASHLTGLELLGDEQQLFAKLNVAQANLEGLLYPDTYFYTAGTSVLALLQRAQSQMAEVLAGAWESRSEVASKHLQSAYEALILASIIEKETGQQGERALISSVFHNRLETRMRLQTDPTVIYGMGERYDGNIRKADLREATPYNTYVIRGLPPTPIAMPGKAAIDAAVQPESSDYFYFVSRGDGSHVFSKTLAEHNANVRQYILNRSSTKE
ncbi:endolytic transglycosylase MltG [Neiella sp. HB171785]|uniref:Endolytic murein transglycosylase n=1 Tax=Neiella litorisoli TaxID=2771431 RepID=A0A8J6QT58_9GAMM|nr:endolytic transglycosylase MltG [Neiella litorisoli]MBD1388462.1 endolytic transglycosylase MltG [Neiella litorisoli]